MAWFRKERKPRTSSRERLEIPPDAWDKCEECGHVDLREKFERALQVCPQCGFHRRISARRYVEILTDPGSFVELFANLRTVDPLGFEGYAARVTRAYREVGPQEAVLTGHGTLTGLPLNVAAMEFAFMGGSMASVVGEKIARLGERALEHKAPLVIVSASGGARMQEGVLSLMQMAKTSVVLAALSEAGLPYISIVTNPTTGGVSASYALQGDVILAEPGAVVGFAGPRVIKQTIGQDLPEGFQTAEFLLEHGMVDAVVPRASLADTTASLLRMMLRLPAAEVAD
ncbi:MAG TPA: acetyl-CoA carboxylase, carboxyltransferase subunit beta [Gemmatimonadales bacterium]|jgi:acetyl-CoA carboxylase carboxyl transferase subunit beta|nr:acetyl-CoA carboxylase, carboxyltransferase subunit beta [Gemmatimonadales bacterium]